MDLQLKGKRAVVNGATRGIGRMVAETLADEGCQVAICARNADQVVETVEALKSKGVSALGRAVDITDGDTLKTWITDAAAEMGGLDILVSNAGAMALGTDQDSWKKNLELDIFGVVNSVDAALPLLKESAAKSGDAAIIAIGSTAAASASDPSSYGAIKASLVHYIKGVARANAAEHVRANVVSPAMVYFKGGIWSLVETRAPERFKTSLARVPMGRMATPTDIANAAVFLASPCSSFTTGINMIIDGAMTERVNY